ncbi:tRNA pseudouridine(13) synthase TruD [Candidatus Micrarchaeota archaeon]|nr:tRNA pseudouridine(13) synthase TruD [Candidatus Micrarchaeota archaeon]
MLSYLSNTPGIGGAIKSVPEDFLVEEISPNGDVYELGTQVQHPSETGPYTHFILQKNNWSTNSAISEISKRLRTNERNFNFAGSKDKLAITTQIASVRSDFRDALLSLRIKDISINGAWGAQDRVQLGDLLGNRFTIRVRDACDGAADTVAAIAGELDGRFPNYFGEQRFGSSRRNTHLVGEKLLKGELEGALLMYLCDSEGETHQEATLARKELQETRDWARALNSFPKHLRLERSMLAHLARKPDDYAGALRSLPRNILLMFIHAFQSDLFNRLLSDRIREGPLELEAGEYFCGETFGFPDLNKTEGEGWISARLIGYNTPLNPREKELFGSLSIQKDAFRMKAIPEIASKGAYRTLLAPLKDFKFLADTTTFSFALPSGSYATMAMREFMDG